MDGERSEPTDYMDEPSGMSIREVKETNQDFANRIARVGMMVQHSLIWDKAMTREQVQDHWRDEFLTNVIDPFLAYIEHTERDRRDEITGRYEDAVATQGEAVIQQELQDLAARINSLRHVRHILVEWRG